MLQRAPEETEKAGESAEEAGVANLVFEVGKEGLAHTWAQNPLPEGWGV